MGLRLARDVLLRASVEDGSALLVSDFEILPDEILRVADRVGLLREDGIDVRLVPLDPTPERRARMDAILGGAAILREKSPDAPVSAPGPGASRPPRRGRSSQSPRCSSACSRVNEGLLSRLEARS